MPCHVKLDIGLDRPVLADCCHHAMHQEAGKSLEGFRLDTDQNLTQRINPFWAIIQIRPAPVVGLSFQREAVIIRYRVSNQFSWAE